MTRSACSVWTRLVALVGGGAAILLASGCDNGGSKRDSLYRQLVGTWKIQSVYRDGQPVGGFDRTAVRLEFVLEGDERSYRLSRSDDTTAATGRARVVGNNLLSMTGAFSLVWRFDFDQPEDLSDSVRFHLLPEQTREEETEFFLNAIGLGGRAQSLRIDLVRESE